MKKNELLVLTVLCSVVHNPSICQTDQADLNSSDSAYSQRVNGNLFRLFTGGINAIYNDDKARGGIDLSVQTYHYFLVTGMRNEKDSLHSKSNIKSTTNIDSKEQFRGFEFFLLNRAAINFDTTGSIANDYITSMQASPLTLRFVKEIFLSKQRALTSTNYTPVISIRLTGDGRAVPYSDQRSQINVGTSGNFYLTFSSQFTRLEFDSKGKEMDRGTMYIQPSIGFAIGNNSLMKSLFINDSNKILLSTECKLGFKSHSKSINDCSLLVRYTPSNIFGPKLRAGVILSSFN